MSNNQDYKKYKVYNTDFNLLDQINDIFDEVEFKKLVSEKAKLYKEKYESEFAKVGILSVDELNEQIKYIEEEVIAKSKYNIDLFKSILRLEKNDDFKLLMHSYTKEESQRIMNALTEGSTILQDNQKENFFNAIGAIENLNHYFLTIHKRVNESISEYANKKAENEIRQYMIDNHTELTKKYGEFEYEQ